MSKEEVAQRTDGNPPLSVIDCHMVSSSSTSTSSSSSSTSTETILLRTEILSLQRNNRNLEHQVEDLKSQLEQVTTELQDVKKRSTREVTHLEKELVLKEEVLDEAIAELDTAKERISTLEKENALLRKRLESRLELSELTSLLHKSSMSSTTGHQGGQVLLRDFTAKEEQYSQSTLGHESATQFLLKKINREDILDATQTSGLLESLRSTLAFWKKDDLDEVKCADEAPSVY